MIINPEVLILDEPFNYLDPSSQINIAKMIQGACHEFGMTVILSSHKLNFVSDISTRILLLEKGLVIINNNEINNINFDILCKFICLGFQVQRTFRK